MNYRGRVFEEFLSYWTFGSVDYRAEVHKMLQLNENRMVVSMDDVRCYDPMFAEG
jgi:hypothetical protein